MRRGTFLLEMMIVMSVMLLVAMIMLKPMRNITRDIPRQQRDYRANSVISRMIDDIRKDVETSNGLTRCKGNAAAGNDMLLIDSPEGVISYTFENGKVTRIRDRQEVTQPSDAQRSWDIPGGVFEWGVRTLDRKTVAVEITTGINRRTHSGIKTNLKNSHVIFVGTDSKGGQL